MPYTTRYRVASKAIPVSGKFTQPVTVIIDTTGNNEVATMDASDDYHVNTARLFARVEAFGMAIDDAVSYLNGLANQIDQDTLPSEQASGANKRKAQAHRDKAKELKAVFGLGVDAPVTQSGGG